MARPGATAPVVSPLPAASRGKICHNARYFFQLRESDVRERSTEWSVRPFPRFYPVVIDVETAGFNAKTDALLEIAAITLKMDEHGWLMPDETLHFHVEPFEGANLQPEALVLTGLTRMTRSAGPSANTMPCMPSSKWCAKG